MRVIAGTYRSRKLQTLKGLALRPSSDRLRETLFNILATQVEDAVFIDLFAGSGAVGIEALSRGARRAVFVENHSAGVALLRHNLTSLGISLAAGFAPANRPAFAGTAEVIVLDVAAALKMLAERGVRADLIFADPPYADARAYEAVIAFLAESDLLARDGQAILEHDRRRVLPVLLGQLERTRVVTQGDSALSFYRSKPAA